MDIEALVEQLRELANKLIGQVDDDNCTAIDPEDIATLATGFLDMDRWFLRGGMKPWKWTAEGR